MATTTNSPDPKRAETQIISSSSSSSTGLQCHLNWIKITNPTGKFKGCIPLELQQACETFIDDNIQRRPFSILTSKINILIYRAVLAHFKDYDTAAALWLETAEVVIDLEADGVQAEHLSAFLYVVLGNRALIAFRAGRHEEAKMLKARANKVNVANPKSKALVSAMKALCMEFFGIPGSEDYFRKALHFDPNVPEYLEGLFIALRKDRIDREPACSTPTAIEVDTIEQAYVLAPGLISVNISMTNLYEDLIKAKYPRNWPFPCLLKSIGRVPLRNTETAPTRQEVVNRMQYFAREVFRACPHSSHAAIRFAEVLCYRPDGHTQTESDSLVEAREQFLLCAHKWPNNSDVMYKVGKFYCEYMTSNLERERGLKYIQDGMSMDKSNIDALTDYFCYKYKSKSREMIYPPDSCLVALNMIENHIAYCNAFKPRLDLLCRLFCLKATLLCKNHMFEEALLTWTRAAQMDPDLLTRKNVHMFQKDVFRGVFERRDCQLLHRFVVDEIIKAPDGSRRRKVPERIFQEACAPFPTSMAPAANESESDSDSSDSDSD